MACIGTHDGRFHADEVIAFSLLKLLPEFSECRLIRSRNPDQLSCCDVLIDVGGIYDPRRLRFDHHQAGFQETFDQTSDIILSSAGLVYKHYAERILCLHETDATICAWLRPYIYRNFIQAIDALDNGIDQYPCMEKPRFRNLTNLSQRIHRLNYHHDYYNQEIQRERFYQAVELFKTEWQSWLDEAVYHIYPSLQAMTKLIKDPLTLSHDRLALEVTASINWEAVIDQLDGAASVVFVFWQDSKGNWCIQSPRLHPESFRSRQAFPEQICGHDPCYINNLTKIPDVIFCHRTGFFAVTKSKESCLLLMEYAVDHGLDHSQS